MCIDKAMGAAGERGITVYQSLPSTNQAALTISVTVHLLRGCMMGERRERQWGKKWYNGLYPSQDKPLQMGIPGLVGFQLEASFTNRYQHSLN